MIDNKKPHTAGTGTASNPAFISGDHTAPFGLPHVMQFKDAIQAAGLTPPDVIEPGKFQRFPGDGKRKSNEAGWCKLFGDGMGGVFGDYSTGLSADWHAERTKPFSDAERAAFKRQIAEARQHAEAQKAQEQANAASKAQTIWEAAPPAPDDHPYLTRKGITANGSRLHGDALVIPLRTGADLHSLQFIDEDGNKRYLKNGRVGGCYFSIGDLAGAAALCIAEGFATGASIHEATGYPVAVALNAGNLLAVTEAMRERFADLPLIVCADDDYRTEGNPGLTKATEAARAVGGLLALPDFGSDRPDGATDFNDMAALCGKDAVREAVGRAFDPAKATTTAADDDAPAVDSAENAGDAEHIERLAKLSPIEYDRVREKEAKALGVRAATLDKMVNAQRKDQTETAGIDFDDVEAWPHPVDGSQLLGDLSATVQRFIICPEETAHAAALWIVMTWFMDVVQVAPLAVITAPEKRCGKSQLLFLLGRLVHRPLAASNITPAALFRAVDAWKPTLLVDEADAFMRDNEELRGLLNCGHTRDSAYIVRVVGDDHTPKRFNVWGAKALAGIGHLADTVMDRSITLELRRKLPNEDVLRLRHAEPGLFDDLASKLARFADDNRETLRRCRPDLPAQLHDRAQDNWEPLLAIAEISGGQWPVLARRAALTLSGSTEDGGTVGNELLADIREVFETKRVTKVSTADLIAELCADDEKSWSTYNRGKPITPKQVAKRLKDYGISSKPIRTGYEVAKGFDRSQFDEAFTRYLSVPPAEAVTRLQPSNGGTCGVAGQNGATVTNGVSVTDVTGLDARNRYENSAATLKPSNGKGCNRVTGEVQKQAEENGRVEVEL
jgi:putative DNA primase/helicase